MPRIATKLLERTKQLTAKKKECVCAGYHTNKVPSSLRSSLRCPHTAPKCTVPTVNFTNVQQPPTILYLRAKFQLQICCSCWDIARRNKRIIYNHPKNQPAAPTQLAQFDIAEPQLHRGTYPNFKQAGVPLLLVSSAQLRQQPETGMKAIWQQSGSRTLIQIWETWSTWAST